MAGFVKNKSASRLILVKFKGLRFSYMSFFVSTVFRNRMER